MTEANQASEQGTQTVGLVLGWLAVVIPLAWGVVQTLKKALALFS